MEEDREKLRAELEGIASKWGADAFGVADLSPAKNYLEEIYGEQMASFPRALSIAVFFPPLVVKQLREGPTHTYLYYYNVLNSHLDVIALRVGNFLQKMGYSSFPVPASQRVTPDKFAGIFSHRLAANFAGLGWIGKNCSLINPEVGPRLRLVTVLTDAYLKADKPLENNCGNCRACIKACPAGALKGASFAPEDSLDARFIPEECDTYLTKVRASFGKRVCGRCIAACPQGK